MLPALDVCVAVGVEVGVLVCVEYSMGSVCWMAVGVFDGVGVFVGVLLAAGVGVGPPLCSRTTIKPRWISLIKILPLGRKG